MLGGEVTGHPLFKDARIATSEVRELFLGRTWAITASRRYSLIDPLPDEELLPPNVFLVALIKLPALQSFSETVQRMAEPPDDGDDEPNVH